MSSEGKRAEVDSSSPKPPVQAAQGSTDGNWLASANSRLDKSQTTSRRSTSSAQVQSGGKSIINQVSPKALPTPSSVAVRTVDIDSSTVSDPAQPKPKRRIVAQGTYIG